MREYEILVLSDCCAAESDHDHNLALQQLEKFCGATICRADELLVARRSARRARGKTAPQAIIQSRQG
jgi:hypothetical protein